MKNAILITLVIIVSGLKCYSQNISRGQTIVAGEYFTNIDPGAGNGTPISANYGSAAANASFTAQVPPGEVLYFRFESSDGTWSTPQPVLGGASSSSGASLVAGEYSIDSDPGIGKATSFSVSTNGKIAISPPPMTRGDTLYMRVKDSYGRWSPTSVVKYDFISIADAQYYIKYANGTTTQSAEMSLIDSLQNYPVFVAVSSSIPALTNFDTVYARVRSENGFWSAWSQSAGVLTAIQGDDISVPGEFRLFQAYPNPFNPSTTIEYELPERSHISIIVYDVLGRNVRTLVNENEPAGTYRVIFDAANVPSGVYFYRLVASGVEPSAAGGFADTKKFTVLK